MIELAFRHLRRCWRRSLALLLWLTLTSALMASLSGYGAAVAARELSQALKEAGPDERSLLITGTPYTFRDELYESLQRSLGRKLEDRLVIRHAALPADPPPSSEEPSRAQPVARLDVYSFDHLSTRIRVVEGRLPAQIALNQAAGYWPPPVEAVIGLPAAEQSGLATGDRLTASGRYHRLDIVGIVEPLDPDGDLWGGDLSAFASITGEPDLGKDALAVPLIISPESMRSYLGKPVFAHQVSWRITLNTSGLGPQSAEALLTNLTNFQTQSAAAGAQTTTGLQRILASSLERLSRLQMALWLLTVLTLILVGYALVALASLVVDQSHAQVATLTARGASAWQVAGPLALEYLILALPAVLLLGPALARVVLWLWSQIAGELLPRGSTGATRLLPALAVALGWLALIIAAFFAARRPSREPLPRHAGPPRRPAVLRRYVDLYLLVFGGLLVWQLNRSGSFLARTVAGGRLGNIRLADPLLLLGPFLLLIAVTLVFMRILPLVLRAVARLCQNQRGLMFPLAVARSTWEPLEPGRVALLVSLTVALALLARILRDSLVHGPEALQSDTLLKGLAGAFQLSAVMLVLFSVMAFLLVHLFEGHVRELSILRRMGLPIRRWSTVIMLVGSLRFLLGLVAGTVAGLGLSYTMIPYLSQALVESLAGVAVEQIIVDWLAIARIYVTLIALYGVAVALLWWILGRRDAHLTPWTEGE